MKTDFLTRDWTTFEIRLENHVLELVFNRPDKLNAMNMDMRLELGDVFLELARETDVRCVLITGKGRAFSAGGDINDFQASAEEMHEIMGRIGHRWFKAFWALPQPVVMAVNGVAAGGGVSLALAGDIVVAAEEASFTQTFHELGLIPDFGAAFILPRLVGLQRAKELALLGERISAQDAWRMGLVNRVVATDAVLEEARSIARRIAKLSPKAATLTKRMMNRSFEKSMEAILDDEWVSQSFLFGTEASKEGIAGFLGKSGERKKTDT